MKDRGGGGEGEREGRRKNEVHEKGESGEERREKDRGGEGEREGRRREWEGKESKESREGRRKDPFRVECPCHVFMVK